MTDRSGTEGDARRDAKFAGERADQLERWLSEVQAPPHARKVLEREIRRLRDVAAMQLARNSLVRDVAQAARVTSLTPAQDMRAVQPEEPEASE